MKKLIPTLFVAALIVAPLAAPQAALAAEKREHHPEIHEAIHALEVAKHRLEHAKHDFGGHREAALQECDKAIEQLKLALQFDKE